MIFIGQPTIPRSKPLQYELWGVCPSGGPARYLIICLNIKKFDDIEHERCILVMMTLTKSVFYSAIVVNILGNGGQLAALLPGHHLSSTSIRSRPECLVHSHTAR